MKKGRGRGKFVTSVMIGCVNFSLLFFLRTEHSSTQVDPGCSFCLALLGVFAVTKREGVKFNDRQKIGITEEQRRKTGAKERKREREKKSNVDNLFREET